MTWTSSTVNPQPMQNPVWTIFLPPLNHQRLECPTHRSSWSQHSWHLCVMGLLFPIKLNQFFLFAFVLCLQISPKSGWVINILIMATLQKKKPHDTGSTLLTQEVSMQTISRLIWALHRIITPAHASNAPRIQTNGGCLSVTLFTGNIHPPPLMGAHGWLTCLTLMQWPRLGAWIWQDEGPFASGSTPVQTCQCLSLPVHSVH